MSRWQGTLQILRFNWPWYALTLVVSVAGWPVLRSRGLPFWAEATALLGMGCGLFWAASSLIVSHWVYDCSPLRRWDWIAGRLGTQSGKTANIHAGFDETSGKLRELFPQSSMAVWDIYRPAIMTEGSILRARRTACTPVPALPVDFRKLPQADGAADAVFLIFAAHEIRSAKSREEFFRELARILRPGGAVLLVEHLRDWKNFAAYGPGFLHFLPRQEWARLAAVAGFRLADEFPITPFVRVFYLTKTEDTTPSS